MVNFVSLFCPELQKLLKPIYGLTRKGRQFLWGIEQQQASDEIKCSLQRPQVLHLPDRYGCFQLYSDTSKFATGSALYQVQNGQPRLIAYASKIMPEAAKNYSITELEMCGLAMNIATFSHLLKKVEFDAIVDHLAITHIMRSKAEPATTRIKRLLELLSPYSFNLDYIKGKDMVLSDFLSRQKLDDSNPHELLPISFSLRDQVSDYFYRIDNEINLPRNDKYLVQTRSQVRSSGLFRLYLYYDMKLVTFGIDNQRNLIVQLPVFVQPYTQKRLVMYQIETVPVPILDKNKQVHSYTELKIEKLYITLNEEMYITLHSQELKMCKGIGYEYYCKELFVIKSKTRYSCASTIYFNL